MCWPSRHEDPLGVLHLQGMHEYETMLEYIARVYDGAHEWAAGWKVDIFKVVEVGPPVAEIDPTAVRVRRHTGVDIKVFTSGRRRPGGGAGAGPANDWQSMLMDLDEDAVDESEEHEPMADDIPSLDASAEEDDCISAGDDSVVESELGSACLSSPSATSSDFDFSEVAGDGDESPPPPPAPADGLESAEGLALLAPADPPLAVPPVPPADVVLGGDDAAGEAAPAPPVPAVDRVPRGVAELEVGVDGGYIRYYGGPKPFMVAHCIVHGERECRLTRTTAASETRGRSGQGRPLGLLLSWLQCGCRGDMVDAKTHKGMRPWPTFDDRLRARQGFADVPESALWFAAEREQREDEPAEEPEKAP